MKQKRRRLANHEGEDQHDGEHRHEGRAGHRPFDEALERAPPLHDASLGAATNPARSVSALAASAVDTHRTKRRAASDAFLG